MRGIWETSTNKILKQHDAIEGLELRKLIAEAKWIFIYVACIDDYLRITKKLAINEVSTAGMVYAALYSNGNLIIDRAQ